jgi:hypothetical protein
MLTRCFCEKCHGTLIPIQTKLNHERKQLKTKTISEQLQRKNELLPVAQHTAGPSSLASPVHLRLPSGTSAPFPEVPGPSGTSDEPGSLAQASISVSDLDGFTNVFYDTFPGIPSGAGDVNPEYVHDDYDFPDEDALLDDADLGDEGDHSITESLRPLVSDSTEDSPDPFVVERIESCGRQGTANLQEPDLPTHLLVVYTMITWLHFQFHLPHVACNAVLAFLALLFRFFKLGILPPFVTLPSAIRALGADPGIQLLAVCPSCRLVYPSSGSKHVQETCTACHIPLFLSEHTKQGNCRVIRTPVIKYPYLPLSDQILSVLKTPGIEALLDDWRTKPRKSGEYGDIFDGRMCRLKLRAPDGSLFFSNHPHEIKGPSNELRIGVNLGVDWCVLCLTSSDLSN